ncbi:hypothetical protein [Dyadobacter psychrotolerans]|uniref:Plasmid mobilization relaxosome protein MobC n=1 Tax=Dyadobacter psychrotolerans TaxID=2541721 RepID=A0A4R5DAQ2_9BACT|nr:hypothetical protein [Dyadobacter psychrotolerans]TDE10732.1 hypothetical protein E0F88_27035 [Dyadobacter psychrotolerans]
MEQNVLHTKSSLRSSSRIGIYLSAEQLKMLKSQFQSSTSRSFSSFLAKLLAEKPMVSTYRNKSVDDYLEELAELKDEFVRLTDLLDKAIAGLLDDREHVSESSLLHAELQKRQILKKLEQIEIHLTKITDQWL